MSRDQRKWREQDKTAKHKRRYARLKGESDRRDGVSADPPPGLEKEYMRGYEGR
jgi:hypothetical protein